jgi:hypothetical protein
MDYEERIRAFEDDLTRLINKYSLENRSNTPDYILAKYLVMALVCVDHAIGVRDAWYGYKSGGALVTTDDLPSAPSPPA